MAGKGEETQIELDLKPRAFPSFPEKIKRISHAGIDQVRPSRSRSTITRLSSLGQTLTTVMVAWPSTYERPIRSALGLLRISGLFVRNGKAICSACIKTSRNADSSMNWIGQQLSSRDFQKSYSSVVLSERERKEKLKLILARGFNE